jgi:hypothetical protein
MKTQNEMKQYFLERVKSGAKVKDVLYELCEKYNVVVYLDKKKNQVEARKISNPNYERPDYVFKI